MASPIPTSTSVTESAVIEAKFGVVWHLIKLESFSNFWSALKSSDFVKGASPDTDVVKWTFKDGTELEVKQEEHSVREPLFQNFGAMPKGTFADWLASPSTTTSPTPSSLPSRNSRTPLS